MSIATAVILNLVAVIGLLGLLAAVMRLPFQMPTSARADRLAEAERSRRRKAAPTTSRARRERGTPEPVYSR